MFWLASCWSVGKSTTRVWPPTATQPPWAWRRRISPRLSRNSGMRRRHMRASWKWWTRSWRKAPADPIRWIDNVRVIVQLKVDCVFDFNCNPNWMYHVTVTDSDWQWLTVIDSDWQGLTGIDSVLQCLTVSYSVLQCLTVSYSHCVLKFLWIPNLSLANTVRSWFWFDSVKRSISVQFNLSNFWSQFFMIPNQIADLNNSQACELFKSAIWFGIIIFFRSEEPWGRWERAEEA